MTSREDIDSMLHPLDGVILQGGGRANRHEEVCREQVVHLFLNDDTIGSLVASPAQLRELGAGFVISEGLASSVLRVDVEGDRVRAHGNAINWPLETETGSSGGLSTGRVLRKIVSDITIDREEIFIIMDGIVSELWERTGGAHCSVLFSGGAMVAKSSDVGRHNTVDKVIGHGILTGIDLSRCVLGCTGRQPAGMISKAVNAGIPIVISKAATTDGGVYLAREAGLTLVCRVKDGRFRVYSHPERIRGLREADS